MMQNCPTKMALIKSTRYPLYASKDLFSIHIIIAVVSANGYLSVGRRHSKMLRLELNRPFGKRFAMFC